MHENNFAGWDKHYPSRINIFPLFLPFQVEPKLQALKAVLIVLKNIFHIYLGVIKNCSQLAIGES
jgi:hypothetical protein